MIQLILGVPGAGKTTYLAWLAKQYIKKGKQVWSNVYIEGCNMLDHDKDLNLYNIQDGLVIIDEGGTVLDNRSWKNHSKRVIRWYKMHRHYNTDVIISSQDYDIDVKIRALTQKIKVVKKSILPKCIVIRTIKTAIDISEDNTQIVQVYKWIPAILGGTRWIYAPKVWKMFDSFYKDKLMEKEWIKWCKANEDAYTYDFTKPSTLNEFK